MERSKWEEGALISDEEAQEMSPALQKLLGLDAWGLYDELLKASRVNARETALAQGKERFDFWQGYISGLEAAGVLPSLIVQQAARAAESVIAKSKPSRRSLSILMGDDGDRGGI